MTQDTEDVVAELKACPFCQKADELLVVRTGAADEWWSEVYCDHCCTRGPTAPTEAEAIAAWNNRDQSLSDRIDVLTRALRELLIGHDNLYLIVFPDGDPTIDIAAKPARAALHQEATAPDVGR